MSDAASAQSRVWTTAWRLGLLFATSPAVRRVAEVIDRSYRLGDDRRPFERALADARGRLLLYAAQPLLVTHHLRMDPAWELITADPASAAFLDAGDRVEAALTFVIEWQRAALPGYPSVRVPRADRRAPRVVDNGFPDIRMPWMLAARREGLQLRVTPPAARPLGIEDVGALVALQVELRAALTGTDSWLALREAHGALRDEDDVALVDNLKAFRARADDEVVERLVGGNLLQRRAYLHALVHEIETGATGRVGDYYRAFGRVDDMIDDIAAVLSWGATVGRVPRPEADTRDWWLREEGWRVRVRGDGDTVFPTLRALFAVDGPDALAGVALVTDVDMDLRAWPLARWNVRGRLLGDSRDLAKATAVGRS